MRLTGLLNKPIIGSYIARLIPLLFGLFFLLKLKKLNRFKDLFIVILSILATGLVYLSGERTSFALILGFFLIVLFLTNYSRKFKFFISIGIIFIILFITILSESTKFRMVTFTFMQVGIKVEKYSFFNDSNYKKFILVRDNMIKSEDNKLFIFSNHHHSHINTAFLIFKDNLAFGTGMKSFRYVCKKYQINDDSCTTHPHNLVLQFLSELGIIGFLFYLISFIFFGLFLIKKIIQKNINNIQNAQISFGAGIFMSLFPLIPSGNFFNNWLSIIFYLTLGFFIYARIKEKNG
jgi:O-antigen ligase